MMKRTICAIVLIGVVASTASADDLYRVTLHSAGDARFLRGTAIEPLLTMGNECLVLSKTDLTNDWDQHGLDYGLIATDVTKDQLAIDRRRDQLNAETHVVVYEKNGFRVLRIDPRELEPQSHPLDILAIHNEHVKIEYSEPFTPLTFAYPPLPELQALIALVSQDSIEIYLDRLQAFNGRVTGSDSIHAARDWIFSKFQDFGYDSVFLDMFDEFGPAFPTGIGYNVVAVKPGTAHPHLQIVVGAHYDAVVGSPGADDNGSGTVGVLEIARILSEIETGITFVFVTFDAHEWGLFGSTHYAGEAAARGDNIVTMWNMDMIGFIDNDADAQLYNGYVSPFAQTWIDLAEPLVGITGHKRTGEVAVDHRPFILNGYDAVFLAEFNFTSYWHSPRDSMTYINFDYLTRMIQASLANFYTVDADDDVDFDGVSNGDDNCVLAYNPEQVNSDGDDAGDACDNCRTRFNPDQADTNDNGIGDVCEDGFTGPGVWVQVDLTDSIRVLFTEVTDAGVTEVVANSTGPEPPTGYLLVPPTGTCYNAINTDAWYTGTVRVRFLYDPTDISREEGDLRVFHETTTKSGTVVWEDCTYSQDLGSHWIWGQVTDLSIFILAEPDCRCDCHADPQCDALTNVLDVVQGVNVAFREGAPIIDPNPFCPYESTDVDCSGFTNVIDVVKFVNVAFRSGDPAVEFCDPCAP